MTLIEEMAMTRLDELGTAREVVSRILEHFEQNGLVRLGRARADVLEPRHLARLSDTTPSGS